MCWFFFAQCENHSIRAIFIGLRNHKIATLVVDSIAKAGEPSLVWEERIGEYNNSTFHLLSTKPKIASTLTASLFWIENILYIIESVAKNVMHTLTLGTATHTQNDRTYTLLIFNGQNVFVRLSPFEKNGKLLFYARNVTKIFMYSLSVCSHFLSVRSLTVILFTIFFIILFSFSENVLIFWANFLLVSEHW